MRWPRRWSARAARAKGSSDAREIHGHILDYASRFPLREMGVMLVSDMHRAIGSATVCGTAVFHLGECRG